MCKVKTYPGTTSIAEETAHLQGLMRGGRFGAHRGSEDRNETSGEQQQQRAVCWPVEP